MERKQIEAMTTERQIKELSNIILEYGQKMKDGAFKTGQDILKIMFEENQKKRFEDENKEYDVVFLKTEYRVVLPNINSECCDRDCCGKTEITIHPRTSRMVLKLHPLLVGYLNAELEVRVTTYNVTTPCFSIYLLNEYLQKNGFKEGEEDGALVEYLHSQFVTLSDRMKAMITETRVGQYPKCKYDCVCSLNIELQTNVILYKIASHKCPPIIVVDADSDTDADELAERE